jgi:hypothetical protein
MFIRSKTLLFAVAVLLLSAAAAMAAPPDQAYITNFGWGKIVVSDKDFPGISKCDMSLFKVKNGIFQITGGKDTNLNCRTLLKDGKGYGFYLNKVKQINARAMATRKSDFIRHRFYVSHDHAGNQLYKTWPTGLVVKPGWTEIGVAEYVYDPENATWTSSGIDKKNIPSGIRSWLEDARVGYKVYVVTTVGFIRDANEQKYWDKSLLKWMIPIEYIDSEPIAAGTFEVAASTNPKANWSCKVIKMPAAMDGKAEGELAALKHNERVATFTFTLQKTDSGNFKLYITKKKGDGENEDTYLGATEAWNAPSLEQAINKAFYDAVDSGLSKRVLPK